MAAIPISKDSISRIMNGDAALLVKEAERFGSALAQDDLSTNQVRGVFGTVRTIQATWVKDPKPEEAQRQLRDVLLLKPRLAYQAKRQHKMQPLAEVLGSAIDAVAGATTAKDQTTKFGFFVDLFEAIVAYHTAYERQGGPRG